MSNSNEDELKSLNDLSNTDAPIDNDHGVVHDPLDISMRGVESDEEHDAEKKKEKAEKEAAKKVAESTADMNSTEDKLVKHKKESKPVAKELTKKSSTLSSLKNYSLLIILLAIIAGLVMLIIVPQYNKMNSNKEKIEKKEKELKKVSAHVDYLERLSSLQHQLEENKDLAAEALPVNDEDVPYYLNQLIQIANASGVEISGLSFGGSTKATDGGTANTVKANMSVSGTYESVVDFLQKIENSRRIIVADNMRISISEPESDGIPQIYTLSLNLTSYFLEEVETENLSIEVLTSKSQPESVIKKLKRMDHYEPRDLDIDVGTINPFVESDEDIENAEVIEESTKKTTKKKTTPPADTDTE